MPRYAVIGAGREDGEDCRIEVEAADIGDARLIAADRGVLVARVEPMPDGTAPAPREKWRATPTPGPLHVQVGGVTWQIAFGVFMGMTAFVAFGLIFAFVFWAFVAASLRGASQAGPSGIAPLGSNTVVATPAKVPTLIEDGPAVPLGLLDEAQALPGVRLRSPEFEVVGSAARWRVTVVNDTGRDATFHVAAAIHAQDGRELWRGDGWRVVAPPGRHIIERTEEAGGTSFDRFSRVRMRIWN